MPRVIAAPCHGASYASRPIRSGFSSRCCRPRRHASATRLIAPVSPRTSHITPVAGLALIGLERPVRRQRCRQSSWAELEAASNTQTRLPAWPLRKQQDRTRVHSDDGEVCDDEWCEVAELPKGARELIENGLQPGSTRRLRSCGGALRVRFIQQRRARAAATHSSVGRIRFSAESPG